MYSWVCRFSVLLLLISLLGCGSSGGGGSGTGDPIEAEVGPIVDAFIAKLEARDTSEVMKLIDGNITYFGQAGTFRYSAFQERLHQFLTNVESLSFTISEPRGIVSGGDDSAVVRGKLVYTYTANGQNQPVEVTEENFELQLYREAKWGVLSFGSLDHPTSFPPQL